MEPLYNKVLGITKYFLYPSKSKIYEKKTSINRNLVIACYIIASPLALHYIQVPLYWCSSSAQSVAPKTLLLILSKEKILAFPYKSDAWLPVFHRFRALDSLQFFFEHSLGLVILQARVEHWQQATTGGMTRRKPMVKIYFENNYSMPANSNTICMSFMPGDFFLDLDFTHRQGQFLAPDKQNQTNCSLTHD